MSARAGESITLVGALVNSLLILLKFLAGVFGQSQALIADSVHSFSDLFTDVVVLLGLKISRKAPDEEHQFGHARLETLASGIVGVGLIAAALYLGIDAALNIYGHTEYHPTNLALIGAGVSIALKEALYHFTIRIGRRIKSRLLIANAWHHRSDALSAPPLGCPFICGCLVWCRRGPHQPFLAYTRLLCRPFGIFFHC
jgi:cation diffusion facilitator family transporter